MAGFRSADLYLYLSKTVAERHGAEVNSQTRRALKDVIRTASGASDPRSGAKDWSSSCYPTYLRHRKRGIPVDLGDLEPL